MPSISIHLAAKENNQDRTICRGSREDFLPFCLGKNGTRSREQQGKEKDGQDLEATLSADLGGFCRLKFE